ncbi:MAG: hypothetical protein A3A08_02475 [Candidatus Nealsonbacteria bacterium RIFCSPLOWO2_01_FULL_41_9]|uniref:Uncharacterized protein n=1 Tax=Candidatus Nealsonbacteria bacterium RIFCSPLOWO2_01_FULL_41_9 TaxID=1801671 RepID=A0A1G2E9U2_9BACT|nr:MAG: hypothetical protein A3A08_02475 [Candidatus Nealsonbacteria bacterium RIFCSPLOWO2_01_FULL_41_9]
MNNNEMIVQSVVRVPDAGGQHKVVSRIDINDPGREMRFTIVNGKVDSKEIKLPKCHLLWDNRDLNPGRKIRRRVAAIARGKRRVK